jgi:rifampicin phosphotransferase
MLHQPVISRIQNILEVKDKNSVGNKAYNLKELIRKGFRVPQGCVIPKELYEDVLKANDLYDFHLKCIHSLKENVLNETENLYAEFSLQLESINFNTYLDNLMIYLQEHFKSKKVIIRSSAIGEDSCDASFAGQLDSFQSNVNREQLKENIIKCWMSYYGKRSISYQYHKKKYLCGMSVIIQELVDAKYSGVLFTESDIKFQMIAEYCCGFGDKLVSGQINPKQIYLSQDSQKKNKEQKFEFTETLQQVGVKIRNEFSKAQDVEWVISNENKLYIVQTRPITNGLKHKADREIWSNANMNENYPDPVMPFLGSIAIDGYTQYFKNLGKAFGLSNKTLSELEKPLKNIVGLQTGRLYYNLSNVYKCLLNVPFGKKIVSYWKGFIGVSQEAKLKERKRSTFELLRIFVTTLNSLIFLPLRIRRFENRVHHYEMKYAKVEKEKNSQWLNDFLDIRFNQWQDASLADASSMFSYGLLTVFLNKTLGKVKSQEAFNEFMKGIDNVISCQIPQEIWNLADKVRSKVSLKEIFAGDDMKKILNDIKLNEPEFYIEIEGYLNEWGFRNTGELMMSVPNFQDEPERLISIIKAYLKSDNPSPSSISKELKKKRKEYLNNTFRYLNQKPYSLINKILLQILIKWCHTSIRYRERVRYMQAMLYNRCRKELQANGENWSKKKCLKSSNDIFYLTYQEIRNLDMEKNVDKMNNLIEERKEKINLFNQINPPEYIECEENELYENMFDKKSQYDDINGKSSNVKILKGQPASTGSIQANASILKSIQEYNNHEIDILVTPQTDPGWAPIFPLIKGMVIERGGALSHGAIIAREYGIPAVVGVEKATEKISDGQLISIDGSLGEIKLS